MKTTPTELHPATAAVPYGTGEAGHGSKKEQAVIRTNNIPAIYKKAAKVIAAAPAATASLGTINSAQMTESRAGDGYLVLVLVIDHEGWEVTARWLISYDGANVTRLPDWRSER